MFRNKRVSCLRSSFKKSNRCRQLEANSNPPVSPFFKGDFLRAFKPLFGKEGKGRFFADAGRNCVAHFWVTTRIYGSLWRRIWSLTVIVFTIGGISLRAEAGDVFTRVQSKGAVRCGVSEGLLGFSLKEPNGRWSGLDADFCRAVAAAALDNPEKVVFVPLVTSARFLALRTGQIDVLARHTTWTLGREAGLGVHFTGILYYDGQGFMVTRKSGIGKFEQSKRRDDLRRG